MTRGTWKYAVLALCGGLAAMASFAMPGVMRVVKAANEVTVVTMIDGGNAFVYSDGGKRVDVGAVARPAQPTPGTDFNAHPMFLLLKRGEVQSTPDSLKPQIESGNYKWPLVGFDVEICPESVCPQTSTLSSPTKRTPQVECEPGKDPAAAGGGSTVATDNAYYVPDLLELHPGATLKKDWPSRLDSRLALRTGRLSVITTVGCFTFEGPDDPKMRKQAIAHGDSGLSHELKTDSSFVDYIFSRDGKVVGRVRLKPRNGDGTVMTHVSSGKMAKALLNGQYVEHFTPFYELIDLPVSSTARPREAAAARAADRRIKIRYTPKVLVTGAEASPGGECPPVRFGGS